MYVVLEIDDEGRPDQENVFTSLPAARLQRSELNVEAIDGDRLCAVFELREVD